MFSFKGWFYKAHNMDDRTTINILGNKDCMTLALTKMSTEPIQTKYNS